MGLNKKLCIKRFSADCDIFLYSNFIPVVNGVSEDIHCLLNSEHAARGEGAV